jgi:UPF0042 nucleotide-binding protein
VSHVPTLIVVSGLSGAGKSVALRTFEDLGFDCVDNLPFELLPGLVENALAQPSDGLRLAVGIDVRNRHRDLAALPQWLSAAARLGLEPRLLFFDAEDTILLRRYADTRRRHPLSLRGLSLAEAIAEERRLLKPLRQLAETVIDTSAFNVHQLRRQVLTLVGPGSDGRPSLLFESFAYRRGVPADADWVFDARCLPNPHWDASLRPLSGRDGPVRAFLDADADVARFAEQIAAFLDDWLPRISQDTRSYITVALGCTGGRHRSVYLAERLAAHVRECGWDEVAVHHRELD